MTHSGAVNFHDHKPVPQAFEIDAGGIVGNLISPELVATEVALKDQRDCRTSADFPGAGYAFARVPTGVADFEADGWQNLYDAELTSLMQLDVGAKEVIVLDHTVRIDDPDADRHPARNVHSDYSPKGARKRIVGILGVERAANRAAGHYAFINVWRPVGNTINSAPLGFVRPSAVADTDWTEIDLIYPDRKGQIKGLAACAQHERVYRSRMTPDEIVFFNIYANAGRPPVGHSAIDLAEDPNVTTIRKCIESPTLVRF